MIHCPHCQEYKGLIECPKCQKIYCLYCNPIDDSDSNQTCDHTTIEID